MGFHKKLRRSSLRTSAAEYRHEGEAYLVHGAYADAITDLTEAIRLDPNKAVAYLDRGRAHEEQGQYQEALHDYERAIRLERKMPLPTSTEVTPLRSGCPRCGHW